jgi:hypothetical protein
LISNTFSSPFSLSFPPSLPPSLPHTHTLSFFRFLYAEGTNLDFSSQPIDRVAIMLIAFFKDLAQPLLPQELYNQIVQFKCKSNFSFRFPVYSIQRQMTLWFFFSSLVGEERSSTRTRYLIHSFLKPEIRYIFKYIIEFFREICYKEVSERSRSFKKINISKEPHPSSITSENTSESNNFIVDTPPISDNTDSNQTNTNTHNNNNNLSPTTRTNKTTAKETPVSKVPIQSILLSYFNNVKVDTEIVFFIIKIASRLGEQGRLLYLLVPFSLALQNGNAVNQQQRIWSLLQRIWPKCADSSSISSNIFILCSR